ncbi:MAG: LysM peptidoglycan-binding domain-containing protein [Candidatus Riflebacteria bacterium]|nr:LysM peptidoglycan-binding domain-containing protein [Candidatus Riflebacteria bacterium]
MNRGRRAVAPESLEPRSNTTGSRRVAARLLLAMLLVATSTVLAADYVMQRGDTLWKLAEQHYGDPQYWRALKSYNGIADVYSIPVGTPINFPDKSVLDQVNGILDNGSMSQTDKENAIAGLGGSRGSGPATTPNAGLGRPIYYHALGGLGQRTAPSL